MGRHGDAVTAYDSVSPFLVTSRRCKAIHKTLTRSRVDLVLAFAPAHSVPPRDTVSGGHSLPVRGASVPVGGALFLRLAMLSLLQTQSILYNLHDYTWCLYEQYRALTQGRSQWRV